MKLVHDIEYSKGFPSKKISDWFNGDKKFQYLIKEFKQDAIFTDRQGHFALHSIKSSIPTFVLLRGHYWEEYFWGMKTLGKNLKTRLAIWSRNRISEKVFSPNFFDKVITHLFPVHSTNLSDKLRTKFLSKFWLKLISIFPSENLIKFTFLSRSNLSWISFFFVAK